MRILITGGAGYIGSHAVRCFLEHGHEVVVLDNLSHGHAAAVPASVLVRGDLAEEDLVFSLLRQHRIEAVVHFAAYCYVGESVREPEKYYDNNLVNSLRLLRAMRRAGVSRIVLSSTCATYGIPAQLPITEDQPQRPINPYGRAKLAVEWMLDDFAQAYGFSYAALRYFNAAGASPKGDIGEDHDPETHLIPLVLQAALGLKPFVEIFGTDYPTPDGTCIRDYIHVDDLAEAHRLAVERLQPGVGLKLNLGSETGHSVREVIRVCEQVTGRSIPVREGPRRPGDPPILVASSAKAREVLGWSPRYRDLHSIVETAWRWHSTHRLGYADRPTTKGVI
ncbi:MAG: UDP-glucose 4-epimerase GalE [Gemmatales bacterium]|nr:UDP-glucose 4-epimerase GalE [Gemmatales bacterium]MDW8386284.1 UDP-glucose 4-epimerase GalE [Gemmatales bacterium]